MILEARDRVGGRTFTHEFPDGTRVDTGATWLSPLNTRMIEICKELKIELVEQYDDGDTVMLFNESD